MEFLIRDLKQSLASPVETVILAQSRGLKSLDIPFYKVKNNPRGGFTEIIHHLSNEKRRLKVEQDFLKKEQVESICYILQKNSTRVGAEYVKISR
jgi:hypothetical protein